MRELTNKSAFKEQKAFYDIYIKYPFLIPRDSKGNRIENFDYSSLYLEIPQGWYNLFFQMCEDIKPILEEADLIDSFYFLQVKEKFNYMRCYTNGVEPQEVRDILKKYEFMAKFICNKCGAPAAYMTTALYIASYCITCWEDYAKYRQGDWLLFQPFYEVISYNKTTKRISFEEEWNKYIKSFKKGASNENS